MTNRDESFEELRRLRSAFDRPSGGPLRPRHRRQPDDDAALTAIAHDEGWLVPPAEVTRVALRPWQQAVFWGLRVYIAAMLVVMAIGFAHVAAGK